MLTVLIAALVLLTPTGQLTAQEIRLSDWTTLSSLYTVNSIDVDASGRCWAATTGGVVSYDAASGSIKEFRNVNALQTLDCSAIFCDLSRSEVYVGQQDGALDIYRAEGTWTNIRDIRRATKYPRRAIIDFVKRGDSLLIATEFGIVIWDTRREVFITTIDRIGTLEENTAVRAMTLFADSIWVATDSGLAVAPLNVPTLRLPAAWRVLRSAEFFDATEILSCRTNATGLAVATRRGLFVNTGAGFTKVLTSAQDITSLGSVGDVWEIATASEIKTATGQTKRPQVSSPIRFVTSRSVNGSPLRFIAVDGQGFGSSQDGEKVTMAPIRTPSSNQFADLSVDSRGNLWVATDDNPGRGFGGQGVSWFDGNEWRTINTSNQPELLSNNCYRVSSVSDGTTWVGTWGRGAIQCTPSDTGVAVRRYDFQNSSLSGVAGDSTYVLVSGAEIDRFGRTWLLNEQGANQLLAVRDGSDWSSRANCTNPRENIVRHMAIDLGGTVWLGGHQGLGLIAYNDRNTSASADDICNKLTSGNSQLPDNSISALAVDLNGALWIGTSKGLAVITATGSVSNTTIPFVRRVSSLSSATVVTDIHVDALNYKWIASTSGVFVLDPTGTQVVASVTSSTSPLLSDNVRCITVDETSGRAYFGTSSGCSVARTSSMRPLPDFALQCYPQPFSVSGDRQMVIDGLAPDSDVKIMSVSGAMVAALQLRGRQAIWDGTDVGGNPAPPGIYIVSASSASAGTAAVTKFAVTR
ncbi:MAG: hypothetical protein FGM33_00050 [Candidatus Kapabacteria bacterium]|nr:hypothetical protein [Candidatus Kapabacteria bacterium]